MCQVICKAPAPNRVLLGVHNQDILLLISHLRPHHVIAVDVLDILDLLLVGGDVDPVSTPVGPLSRLDRVVRSSGLGVVLEKPATREMATAGQGASREAPGQRIYCFAWCRMQPVWPDGRDWTSRGVQSV